MSEIKNDNFNKIEQFLLRVALLALLVTGLLRVIAPELKALSDYFSGGQESNAANSRTEQAREHTKIYSKMSPEH
jgi:hypothetical protein